MIGRAGVENRGGIIGTEFIEKKSLRRNRGGGIMEQKSWRRNHRARIVEEQSWSRNHGGGIMEAGITEQESCRNLEASASIWETPKRHLAPRRKPRRHPACSQRHPRGAQEARGKFEVRVPKPLCFSPKVV